MRMKRSFNQMNGVALLKKSVIPSFWTSLTLPQGWFLNLGVGCVAILIGFPVLTVVISLIWPASELWPHMVTTVLPRYITNSLILAIGSGIGVAAYGTLAAWLVSMYQFPGKRFLQWALVLPLAMPAYVLAYAYTDFLQAAGPLQSLLRDVTGWHIRDYWFPNIRSVEGAVILFTSVLYPYVYLLARATFLEQSMCILEASRTLGMAPKATFWRVGVPLARPAIATGTALALMEVLADFGTISFFGIPTFTSGIYRAWYSLGDPLLATQLSSYLLGFVVFLLLMERLARRQARYHAATHTMRDLRAHPLTGLKALLASLVCIIPVCLGFVFPALILIAMITEVDTSASSLWRYADMSINSFILAGLAACVTVCVALLLTSCRRLMPNVLTRVSVYVASVGYAMPGSIIAVGVLVPLAWIDQQANILSNIWFGRQIGLVFTGTIAALVIAYAARFSSISIGALDSGYSQLRPSYDDAARTLGTPIRHLFARIHFPLLRGSALTAFLIVFVDVMKELPATLLIRPFNFDTLAVQAHNYAADERLPEAAVASLCIAVVGLIPVYLLSRQIVGTRGGRSVVTSHEPGLVQGFMSQSQQSQGNTGL